MLIKRLLAVVVMAGIGIPAIIFGGVPFFIVILIFVGMAAWEYVNIFRAAHLSPSMWVTVGGVVVILAARNFLPELAGAALALLALLAMAVHLLEYERGCDHAGTDFAVTVGGLLYLGWIGAYLLDLRALGGKDGMWYLLLVLGTVWLADSAAYIFGKRFGKHPLAPRLSPKKTWEGYWAGVAFGTLGGAGLAVLWHALGGPDLAWWQGLVVGAVMSVLTTLGDVGESMFKRQVGVKDSSNIIPGHGGFLDRIDAWLWAGVLGYYLISWFFL